MKVLNTSPHHLDTPSIFQDRKMDGPNAINNYSPLTMTPKLLTLQLPMMVSTTTTSHNVAHVPSDRNIALGNNSVEGSGKSTTWDTVRISRDGNGEKLKRKREREGKKS